MRNLMIVAVLLFLTVSFASASPSWRVEREVDSMTDEATARALVTNEEGHTFSVYRRPNKEVWLSFRVSDNSSAVLSSQHLPIWRVDKFAPHDMSARKLGPQLQAMIGEVTAEEPKWVHRLLWHGIEEEGRAPGLRELMEGRQLRVRYFLFTGGFKETVFPLSNAKQSIANALEISEAQNPNAERLHILTGEAVFACNGAPTGQSDECRDKVLRCNEAADVDPARFQSCMAQEP